MGSFTPTPGRQRSRSGATRSEPATGDLAQAKTNLTRAARLRPRLDYALPWSAAAFHSATSNPRMTSSANPP